MYRPKFYSIYTLLTLLRPTALRELIEPLQQCCWVACWGVCWANCPAGIVWILSGCEGRFCWLFSSSAASMTHTSPCFVRDCEVSDHPPNGPDDLGGDGGKKPQELQ